MLILVGQTSNPKIRAIQSSRLLHPFCSLLKIMSNWHQWMWRQCNQSIQSKQILTRQNRWRVRASVKRRKTKEAFRSNRGSAQKSRSLVCSHTLSRDSSSRKQPNLFQWAFVPILWIFVWNSACLFQSCGYLILSSSMRQALTLNSGFCSCMDFILCWIQIASCSKRDPFDEGIFIYFRSQVNRTSLVNQFLSPSLALPESNRDDSLVGNTAHDSSTDEDTDEESPPKRSCKYLQFKTRNTRRSILLSAYLTVTLYFYINL